jgi:hypothetical protein
VKEGKKQLDITTGLNRVAFSFKVSEGLIVSNGVLELVEVVETGRWVILLVVAFIV